MISASNIFADSYTFSSQIYSVSSGYGDFGFGYFPVATSFGYGKGNITLNKNLKHKAYASVGSSFSLGNRWINSRYDYDTGRPQWILKNYEQKNFKNIGGEYFAPQAYVSASISQGFGENPFNEGQALTSLSLSANVNYQMAYESLSRSNSGSSFTFVDDKGALKAPYGEYLNAFPWLSGDRKVFTNSFTVSSSWNLYKSTGRSAYDGLYFSFTGEFGPSWFGNTNQYGVMSDFYRLSAYIEEKLTLFNDRQNDGSNWLTIFLGHSNSIRYLGGDVIPENQIPSDRLRSAVSDSLWLEFQLPQFLVGDCFSYLQLCLNNNLYFGHVVNEGDQSTVAAELTSSIYAYYHLRLFGFIKFEYRFGFDLFSGIWMTHPGFSQWATVTFNVSL